MFISDIDAIVEDHDSAYINGEKNMFVSWFSGDDCEIEEEDDEPETYDVEYYNANGEKWWLCDLTAEEKAHWDALTPTERIEYAEQFE